MADLSFPWAAVIRAQMSRDRDQENVGRDIAGIGEGLGKGIGAVGQSIIAQRKQGQQNKAISEMLANPLIPPERKQEIRLMSPYLNQSTAGQILPELLKKQDEPVTIYFNPANGRYSPVPGPGVMPVQVKTSEATRLLSGSVGKQFAPPKPQLPKPIDPVGAAKVDVSVQKANQPGMMDSLLSHFGYQKPQIQNPLAPKPKKDSLGIL